MEDSPGEAADAAPSQVHGWSSYSLPSQPPDIRNWFASYEYESLEDSEIVADPGAHNGSETQDPFQGLQHPVFPQDDGVAVRKNRLGDQSESHFLNRKDLVPTDENESIAQKPPKRKQSLRALFGFLEEATESEFQMVLPAQRNALEPPPICNATRLLDAKQSQEGAIKSGKVSVQCYGINSVDTQVSSHAVQVVGCSELPVTCAISSLSSIQNCFQKDSIEHGKVPVDFKGISSVETQASSQLEYCELPFNCVNTNIFHIKKCLPDDSIDNIEHGRLPADSSGISSVDTQVSSPADQEVEYIKLPSTNVVSDLADKHQKDGIDIFEMPINNFGTNVVNTEKSSRDCSEHNILPVCQDSIILADTKEKSPVKEFGRCKPPLDSKGPEQIVADDGFVAIKRKRRIPEEGEANKIPKYPTRRDKEASQENCTVSAQKVLAQMRSRGPLTDRTNFLGAPASPTAEFSGKWKCPSKGKPHVGHPKRQLRLDQWLR